jgi:AraC-like DNA-binding protein
MKQARRLSTIAKPGQIVISDQLKGVYDLETEKSIYRMLTRWEEVFLQKLYDLTENNLHSTSFDVNKLCSLIGMSRPQLYRKVTALIGLSPKAFIQAIKMRKALDLIKGSNSNISEIAFDLGYSNPSHFIKIFRERFSYSPSQMRE